MMPIRLTVVLTHPVQYYVPWFRQITELAPELCLTVLYGTLPSDHQRGVGFGTRVDWGIPLLSGYHWTVLEGMRPTDAVGTGRFWGIRAKGIERAVAATRPDVVLIPGWHSILYLRALLRCRLDGVPVLYRGDTHAGCAPTGLRGAIWRAKNRVLLALFDRYLTVGTRATEFLAASGVESDRIYQSPHAVDNRFFAERAASYQTASGREEARAALGIDNESFVMAFVGKLEPAKRPLDLVRAAALVGSRTVVLLAGAGSAEQKSLAEARRLGVRLANAGFVDQNGLGRIYAAADCLVLPSESETWGLVVNEALATGLPCIVTTGVGCGPDLIASEDCGEIYPTGDVDALARALRRVRQRLALDRARVGQACRSAAQASSLDAATSGLVDAARGAVAGGSAVDSHPGTTELGYAGAEVVDETRAEDVRMLVCGHSMVVVGGLERVILETIQMTCARGAQVHVAVNDWGSERIRKRLDEAGASWSYVWSKMPLRRRELTPFGVVRLLVEILRTSAGILAVARRFHPTAVVVPDYTAAIRCWFALLWLRISRIPVINRLGNAPETGRFYRRLWKWVVDPVTTTFICNSDFTANALHDCGVSPLKTHVIYNSLPTRSESTVRESIERPARDPHRIVYVGQIIPDKGLDLLFDAVELLVRRGVQVTLDVVGDLDGAVAPVDRAFADAMRKRAEAAPLASRVRLLGWREDVDACLRSASVHCCPSRPAIREAFGLVVLEAKHAGIPSVVLRSGALPELVSDRVDGWVCDDDTPEALAEGLGYFLTNPEACRSAGRRARESTRRFDGMDLRAHWWHIITQPARLPIYGLASWRNRMSAHGKLT